MPAKAKRQKPVSTSSPAVIEKLEKVVTPPEDSGDQAQTSQARPLKNSEILNSKKAELKEEAPTQEETTDPEQQAAPTADDAMDHDDSREMVIDEGADIFGGG